MTTVTQSGTVGVAPDDLADTLKAVKPAVSRRSAVEALHGVRVRFDGHIAFLHATDMEVHVRRHLPVRGMGELDVVVAFAELGEGAGEGRRDPHDRRRPGAGGRRRQAHDPAAAAPQRRLPAASAGRAEARARRRRTGVPDGRQAHRRVRLEG